MTKAGAWRRFGARVVDGLVLVIPVVLVTAVIGGGLGVRANQHHLFRLFLGRIAGTALTYAYFVWMESQRGRTLGKDVFGMHVEGDAGERPTQEQAMRRNWFIWIGAVPLAFMSFVNLGVTIAIGVTIANDPEGRGFHDKWAGSVVRRR